MISTETSATVIVLLPLLVVGHILAVVAFLGIACAIVLRRRAKAQ